MKVLHSAALLRPPIGVLRQMEWEQAAASELGLDWMVRMFCPKHSIDESPVALYSSRVDRLHATSQTKKAIAWFTLRKEYHRWLLDHEDSYDVLLLRYYVHDPFQMMFLKRSRKPVYLVHHTLEGPELAMAGGIGGMLRSGAEKLIGPTMIRLAQGVIGVTPEISEYETWRAGLTPQKKLIVCPNGVLYRGNVAADKRGNVPELLFIASGFSAWHGLDLLLMATRKSAAEFVLHVIGDVSTEDQALASNDARVKFHGRLTPSAIEQLAAKCHLGLASFALFRKNMAQACTLKVREYLMLGLPVYAGYQDVFPDDFLYYRCGECDMHSILAFAAQCHDAGRADISNAAKPYIDKTTLVSNLYAALSAQVAARD